MLVQLRGGERAGQRLARRESTAVVKDSHGGRDGGSDGATDSGPEGEQGDGGSHVGVRDGGLRGDLGADDREGSLEEAKGQLGALGEAAISTSTHSERDHDLRHDEVDVCSLVAGGEEDETHADRPQADSSELDPLVVVEVALKASSNEREEAKSNAERV